MEVQAAVRSAGLPIHVEVVRDAAGVVQGGPYGFRLIERLFSGDDTKIVQFASYMPLLNEHLVNMLQPACSKGLALLREKLKQEPSIAWSLWAQYTHCFGPSPAMLDNLQATADRLAAHYDTPGASKTSPSRESRA